MNIEFNKKLSDMDIVVQDYKAGYYSLAEAIKQIHIIEAELTLLEYGQKTINLDEENTKNNLK